MPYISPAREDKTLECATLINLCVISTRAWDASGVSRPSRRQKRRERTAPMPAASAGLLRFFEEETQGIKIRPELVVVLAVSLILAVIMASVFFAV